VRAAIGLERPVFNVRFVLRGVYSDGDIDFLNEWRPLQGPRLDLQRTAFLIHETLHVGAKVARVTAQLRHWCQLFHADEDAAAIVSIAAYGADATFVAPYPPWEQPVPNAIPDEHTDWVTDKISAMVAAGEVVPVHDTSFPSRGISALIMVINPGGKKRLCHDYSRPEHLSVNAGIQPYLPHDTYAKVTDVAAWIRPHSISVKSDLSNAFRSLPMAPAWHHRHCFRWAGVTYADTRLPFGNAASPSIFNRVTQGLTRLMKRRGFPATAGYLDDFYSVL
jgi:hypothetical protein